MKKKQQLIQKYEDKKVTITLDEFLIKYLLGALSLGMTLEELCAYDTYSYGTVDTHSMKWQAKIIHIFTEIKKQTGVTEVCMEYGDCFENTGIAEFVQANCERRDREIKASPEYIEAQAKFDEIRKQKNAENNK